DSNGDSDSDSSINDVDTELDFCFELDCAASIGVLTEADVSAIPSSLETSQTLSDCEMEALLGGAFDVDVGTNDIDVDALLFV
ncbi:hypothetical protein PI124_g21470, partial [Phytophthora idaei]